MDLKNVKKIIELAKENDLAELVVEEKGCSVKVVVNQKNSSENKNEGEKKEAIKDLQKVIEAKPDNKEHIVKSPMVGVVYLSSMPGSNPFVTVGQKVKVGDTLCLIEAMKTFNRVDSDVSGVVSVCLVDNSRVVEYGQPLFIIEKE